ncbi:hypothetical protein Tco_0511726 [Tanacetum coccineum]
MRDVNPIRTLGDYSKPSHEGYRNTIELPEGNNVVPLRSDTIRLDPSPHGRILLLVSLLKSFHREGLQNFAMTSLCSNLSEAWNHLKDLLQKVPHHGIDLWLQVQIFYDHVNPVTRRTIDQSAGGKLRNRNAKESWALLEDLALYDDKSWNDPRDFAKPFKAISLPQDVMCTSDRCLIELKNQVQRLMEAHLASMQPTQVNKITPSCEICSSPHDTQYCMENPEQAFVDYASSRTDETGSRQFAINQGPRSFNEAANAWKGKPNFNWAHAQTFTSPWNGSGALRQGNQPSKLLSPKYLSQSSLAEQNRNPSSLKRVHFVNSIVILNKENEAKEVGNVNSSTTEYKDHEMTVESEEGFEEETEEEIKEEEEDSPKHFDTSPL